MRDSLTSTGLFFLLSLLPGCAQGDDESSSGPEGLAPDAGYVPGQGGAPAGAGGGAAWMPTPYGGAPPVPGGAPNYGGAPGLSGAPGVAGAPITYGGSPGVAGAPVTYGGSPGVAGAPSYGGDTSAGGAPQGAGGDSGAAGAPNPNDDRPPCLKNGSQVISMGDSYMNWGTHTFPTDLNAAAGVTFRPTYAVGGFSMGSGGIGLIPPQLDTALAQDRNIIAVVLDGGGNDVLIPALGRPDCKNMANSGTVAGCQQIVTDALAAAKTLLLKGADAGIHDVVYFFYPHVPEPTALGGSHPNAMLDYALPRVKEFCDGAAATTNGRTHCWFVDTVPLFAGHPEYFAAADVHENSTGSKVIAKAVVDTMKAHCIAQPESSGCCKP